MNPPHLGSKRPTWQHYVAIPALVSVSKLGKLRLETKVQLAEERDARLFCFPDNEFRRFMRAEATQKQKIRRLIRRYRKWLAKKKG